MSEASKEDITFFPYANEADIVRASQKDDYYKRDLLYDKIFSVTHRIIGSHFFLFIIDLCCHWYFFTVIIFLLGPAFTIGIKEELALVSDFIYYGVNTLLGRQTLGEEYCDIMHVKGGSDVPLLLVVSCTFMFISINLLCSYKDVVVCLFDIDDVYIYI